SATTYLSPLSLHRRSSDLGRLLPEEHGWQRFAPAHLGDAEAVGVEHLSQLVQRIQAQRVLVLQLLASVEDHRPLHVKPRGEEVRSEEHTSELQSRENLVCR